MRAWACGAGGVIAAMRGPAIMGSRPPPGPLARHLGAARVAQGASKARHVEREAEAMLLGHPVGEMRRELEQHVVAARYQQRPAAHRSSASRAATSCAGETWMAAAQAMR